MVRGPFDPFITARRPNGPACSLRLRNPASIALQVRSRLFLLLLVPCLALIGLAAVVLNSSNRAYRQAQADSAFVEVAVAIAEADQALGNEAVVSSQYLHGLLDHERASSATPTRDKDLRAAWTQASSAIDAARFLVGQRGSAASGIEETLLAIQRSLSYRRDITGQTVSPLQIADRYSQLRASMLDDFAAEANSEVSAGSNNNILVLLKLIRARSAHVDERLVLQLATEYEQWAPGQHSAVIDAIVTQRERLGFASRLQGQGQTFRASEELEKIRSSVFLDPDVPAISFDEWLDVSDERLDQLDALVEDESNRILQNIAAVEDQRYQDLVLTIVGVLSVLAIAGFVALYTAYRLIRRVERITGLADAMARDHSHKPAPIGDDKNDEIGILARAFDDMAARITRSNRQQELESGVLEKIAQRASIDETFDASARLLGETVDGQPRYRLDVRDDDEIVVARQDGRFGNSPSDDEVKVATALARMALQRANDDAQLEVHATRDDLTGLFNRRAILHRVDELTERNTSGASSDRAAVVFVDLDDFKEINDRHGHAVGDQALVIQSERLAKIVGDVGGVAGRLGGDEFLLAFPSIAGDDELQEKVDLVVAEIGKPIVVDDLELRIGLSAGAALVRTGLSTAELLNDADTALYKAKSAGRGIAIVATDDLRAQSLARAELEVAFRLALERHEFQPWFQPIWSQRGESLAGLEALARWQRPDGQMVMPGDFLTLAEDLNLMGALDSVLLHTTCTQVAAWHRAGIRVPRVNINVSPIRLDDPLFVSETLDVLQRTGCRPEHIAIEVTETALISNVSVTAVRLQELRDAGIAIAVDDFGQGYSSLAYLRELPVDVLKIDREFISFIDVSTTNRAIVAAISQMAEALALDVVAEGVERKEELDLLAELGCPLVQGYLLGRPIPIAEAEVLLVANGCRVQTDDESDPWFVHAPETVAGLELDGLTAE